MDKQQVTALKAGDKVKFVEYYHGVPAGTVARIPDDFKPPSDAAKVRGVYVAISGRGDKLWVDDLSCIEWTF